MEKNDKIIYTYEHFLNSKSKTIRQKEGIFIRKIYKRGYIKGTPDSISQNVVVKLAGNKNNSIVHRSSICLSTNS